jgi:hypothetical protein
MKITATELAYVRAQGLYITEKCDGCGKLLNKSFRYTIAGKPEVYCSGRCCDLAFFGNIREAEKHSTPGKCVYCGGSLEGKKRGSVFCDGTCGKAHARKIKRSAAAEPEKSPTPTQSNQLVASLQKEGQGDCIASGTEPPRNVPSVVSARSNVSVEAGPATRGAAYAELPIHGGLQHTRNDDQAEEPKRANAL